MRKALTVIMAVAILLASAVDGNCLSAGMLKYDKCVSVYGGSGTCVDRATAYYRGLGYSGTLTDMESAYLGDLGYTGTLWDRWNAFLGAQGLTGTLGERFAGTWSLGDTFWATFTDPASPLTLLKGTGTLSDTRNTTSTYVHRTTDLVTVASANTGRIEDNGVLIEGARTNLSTYQIKAGDNPVWVPNNSSPTDNVIAAPEGTTTGTKIMEDAASAHHSVLGTVGINGGTYFSIYAKAGTRTDIGLALISGAGNKGKIFKLSDQTMRDFGSVFAAADAASITTLNNGWYRCAVYTSDNTTRADVYMMDSGNERVYQGDNTSYLYVADVQLEQAAFLSSYIPTMTEAVTRNADVLIVASSGNIDNVDGTLSMTWTPNWGSTTVVGTPVLFDVGGVKATYTAADDKINFTDGTNTISTAALTFSANIAQKLAFRWGPGGLDIYRNGASAATGATFSDFLLNENFYIGSDVSSANQAYSNFEDVRVIGREASDAEMIGLTQ